jgi:Mrp family chromosome partitioning ATPase
MENVNSSYESEQKEIATNISQIKNKIAIISGKGGVGKSTIASNLAGYFASLGFKTGLLDVDVHGPSIPKMLGLEGLNLVSDGKQIIPIEYSKNLKVISVGFLLKEIDDAVIWRGPKKTGIIRSFLKDVKWDKLDYLIIDCPPGTGDEPLSILQSIEDLTGAVIVTSPQDVALTDVRKAINFCKILNTPILGIIENMSGFTCPHCNKKINIFKSGGGEKLAKEFNIPLLGSIPINPTIVEEADKGELIILSKDSTDTEEMINAFKNIKIDNKK